MTNPAQRSIIRAATGDDAPGIVAAHISSWQWAYRGQMPDDFLDRLGDTGPRREAALRERLGKPLGEHRIWVAELGGRVVGFAETGPARDANLPPHTAELFTIYLTQDAAGKGIGRSLMARVVDELREQGFRHAILWVLESNARARRFYEAAGWHPDGATKTETRWDLELKEVRYARALG